jgi:hypothetical protein
MNRRRVATLETVWTKELGLDDPAAIRDDLSARLAYVVTAVTADVVPAGSAEAAVAFGDVSVLIGFLADARRVLQGKEILG